MTIESWRCAACGGPPGHAEVFDCSDCGRPLAACADPDCGWVVRLFASDDPGDCVGCAWREKDPAEDARLLAAYGPCPDCGGPRRSPEGRCLRCSIGRLVEQQRQMQARSGRSTTCPGSGAES